MGNTSGKAGAHGVDDLSSSIHQMSGRGKPLSEREASSAWYRYGVAVTDVYDVVEILGHGHMGEVFTVRRKTTGHHTDLTRERTKESEDDLKLMLKTEKDAKDAGRARGKKKEAAAGGDGKSRKRSTFKGAMHKTKKVITGGGKGGKEGKPLGEDADSNLAPFISEGTEAEEVSHHEPPTSGATPVRSAIRTSRFESVPATDGERSVASLSSLGKDDTDGEDNVRGSFASLSMALGDGVSRGSFSRDFSRGESTGTGGGGGTARKGVHFQRTFAVKTILTSRVHQDQLQELVNEIMIMRKLDHPYILKLYEVYHVKRKLWLVTELLSGGDLSSRKLNEHDTKNVIEQVLRALVYLHRMGIVHRDIKLENVLYENHGKRSTVRLIDFGLSRTFDRTNVAADYMRTPYTMSPEASSAGKRGKGMIMTDKTDVWAVGVITFIMLSGEFPFIKTNDDLKDPNKLEALRKADFHFGITWKGRGITASAKEFVKGCLQADPDERWTAKQALEHLQKHWGPDVDKIWDAWQAEMKKNKKPEYVPPQALPKDDEDCDDNDTSSQSGSDWLQENEDDVPAAAFDQQLRAQRIKKHVANTVMKMKAECPSEEDMKESVKMEPHLMEEIEKYTKFGFMKKTILITMANTMDRGDVGKLRELFLQSDVEDTGTITLKELLTAFRKVSPEVEEKRVEELFFGIDRDKSGHIHYAEFLAALAESHGLVTMDRLAEAFDRIDTDGKGYITHEDLKSILGKDYDKGKVDKMIEEGDFKKNNKIDYEELLQLMFSDPVQGDALAGSVSVSPMVSFGDE